MTTHKLAPMALKERAVDDEKTDRPRRLVYLTGPIAAPGLMKIGINLLRVRWVAKLLHLAGHIVTSTDLMGGGEYLLDVDGGFWANDHLKEAQRALMMAARNNGGLMVLLAPDDHIRDGRLAEEEKAWGPDHPLTVLTLRECFGMLQGLLAGRPCEHTLFQGLADAERETLQGLEAEGLLLKDPGPAAKLMHTEMARPSNADGPSAEAPTVPMGEARQQLLELQKDLKDALGQRAAVEQAVRKLRADLEEAQESKRAALRVNEALVSHLDKVKDTLAPWGSTGDLLTMAKQVVARVCQLEAKAAQVQVQRDPDAEPRTPPSQADDRRALVKLALAVSSPGMDEETMNRSLLPMELVEYVIERLGPAPGGVALGDRGEVHGLSAPILAALASLVQEEPGPAPLANHDWAEPVAIDRLQTLISAALRALLLNDEQTRPTDMAATHGPTPSYGPTP